MALAVVQPRGQTCLRNGSFLARGRLAPLGARRLLLRGSATLLRAGARPRFLSTAARGAGAVGNAGGPGLRHALFLQLLVLLLVLDVRRLRRHLSSSVGSAIPPWQLPTIEPDI